ncbi:hypothetical protein [Thiolapillus sp.]|nr:hypothetical protein [Thiolapillus sp.]
MKFEDMDIGYISQVKGKAWTQETRELSAMLAAFITSIRNQLNSDN